MGHVEDLCVYWDTITPPRFNRLLKGPIGWYLDPYSGASRDWCLGLWERSIVFPSRFCRRVSSTSGSVSVVDSTRPFPRLSGLARRGHSIVISLARWPHAYSLARWPYACLAGPLATHIPRGRFAARSLAIAAIMYTLVSLAPLRSFSRSFGIVSVQDHLALPWSTHSFTFVSFHFFQVLARIVSSRHCLTVVSLPHWCVIDHHIPFLHHTFRYGTS